MIVGCGPSILEISKKSLKELNNEYFTVGMSFASYLDIDFDLYYAECIGKHQYIVKEFYEKKYFLKIYNSYKQKKIKLLIHKDFEKSYNFFKMYNLNCPKEICTYISTGSKIQVLMASFLTRITKFIGIGFQSNGTLSYILLKMIDYGAKEIVLAGVDLDDNGYFFENKKWKGEKIKFPHEYFLNVEYKKKNKNNNNKIHKTNNPEFYKITMRDFLILINLINRKLKIKLALKKGNLKDDFPAILKTNYKT